MTNSASTPSNSYPRPDEGNPVRALLDALAKIMPITFENGPDYMALYFGDGETHRSQAMTMNPQDWADLEAAYNTLKSTGEQA